MQKDNEKAVSEMKTLAESFEKEVTEEGELEPSARCACCGGSGVVSGVLKDSCMLRWHHHHICLFWHCCLAIVQECVLCLLEQAVVCEAQKSWRL